MMTENAQKKPPVPLDIGHNVALPKLIPPLFRQSDAGKFVSVRPAGKEHADKTYLGIYMGDMPYLDMQIVERPEHNDKALRISRRDSYGNPAIYVPTLNQIFYGVESWWGVIKSPDQLRKISDADINSVWYVQALESLSADTGEGEASQ